MERMMPITGSPWEKEMVASTKTDRIDNKEMDNESLNADDHSVETIRKLGIFYPIVPKHQAAVRLLRVCRSYPTRRILADWEVLVEQRWYVSIDQYKLILVFFLQTKT